MRQSAPKPLQAHFNPVQPASLPRHEPGALIPSAVNLLPQTQPASRIFLPATLALALQGAALLCVLAIAWLLQWLAAVYLHLDFSLSLLLCVLLQATIAALFSVWAGMASWWRWIHAGFPLAICLMTLLHVPSAWYLFGFIVSLALFWTTFRSQVPFFPSRPVVWQQLAQLLPAVPLRIVDIGSGLGDLSMHLSALRSDCRLEGVEIAPLPWLVSYLRARLRRSAAVFKLGDYQALDFGLYDVIFAYLSPAAMPGLWQKARLEMRPGAMLISYEFDIVGVAPTAVVATAAGRAALYVWRID